MATAKGLTLEEISQKLMLEKGLVKKYIEGPLKEDIRQEKLEMDGGRYDPFILELISIEYDVDRAAEKMVQILEQVKRQKAA